MITKEDADNLESENPKELVDIICTQSELIDDLYSQLKKRDEEIERLKEQLKIDLNEPLKSITINQMSGGKDEY